MAGIAAIIGAKPFPAHLIAKSTHTIRHRGPDGQGFALFHAQGSQQAIVCESEAEVEAAGENVMVALGYRHLCVGEESHEVHQPLRSDDGRYWMVCDGELYNLADLRCQLLAEGHRLNTDSQYETILSAYHLWGEECLHRLNGVWSLVIYDTINRTIFVARDRFGVKPLYYWQSPEGYVAFASEIKQFTALPGWNAKLNGQRAYDYLVFGITDHTNETLFDGVYQVRGGEFATIDSADLQLSPSLTVQLGKWYQLATNPSSVSLHDAIAAFRDLFIDAVKIRLPGDIPFGTGLSGGLDSTSVVCVANDLVGPRSRDLQKTVSACSTDPRFDEREFIEMVTKERTFESHYVFPSFESVTRDLDEIVWYHDEPYGGTSVHAEWEVFRHMSHVGVQVALEGHGADETLVGYHSFFQVALAESLVRGRWRSFAQEVSALRRLHGYGTDYVITALLKVLLPERVRQALLRLRKGVHDRPQWLNLDALGAVAGDPERILGARKSGVNGFSLVQLMYTSLPMQLTWADRDAMAHGIVCRLPYLDHRLVEFMLSLPREHKLNRGITKRLSREAMRGILPEGVRLRADKMGFETPEEVWVREEHSKWFGDAVREVRRQAGEIFTPSLEDEMQAIISGARRYSPELWRIVCFGAWFRRFQLGL